MINIDYRGLKCGVCGKDFKEDDDVVVCPECGTPMHRLCYKENNGCPNSDKHGKEFVSEDFEKIKKSAQGIKTEKEESESKVLMQNASSDEIICQYCGERNRPEANFCNRCGAKLVKIPPIPSANTKTSTEKGGSDNFYSVPSIPSEVSYALDPLAGIPAEAEFEENVTTADLACYVSVNTPYYMKAFNVIKRKSGKFNFSALIFSGVWLLYRKLYKIGALIFALETLLYAVRFYFTQTYSMKIIEKLFADVGLSIDRISSLNMDQYMELSSTMQKLPLQEQILMMIPSFMFLLQIILMIVCGVIGNKVYYKNCVRNIQWVKKQAEEQSLDKTQTAQALYIKGGVNPFLAGALCLFYLYITFA